MRRTFFLPAFLFSTLWCFSQNNIDVLHYKFNIGLNDMNDTIHGVAEIKVKFINPSSMVDFDLTKAKANSKGMTVLNIEGYEYASRIHENDKLHIRLPKRYNTADTITFVISYSGIPTDG